MSEHRKFKYCETDVPDMEGRTIREGDIIYFGVERTSDSVVFRDGMFKMYNELTRTPLYEVMAETPGKIIGSVYK